MSSAAAMGSAGTFTARQFRDAAGLFASGVTVVTARDDAASTAGSVRGMTASSFVSVSLAPPLVLVSLANDARMLGLIRLAGGFGISVLAAHQQALSRVFAGQAGSAATGEPRSTRFARLADTPVIENALAMFACGLHELVVAGDHTLVVGRVVDLRSVPGDPLLFYGGYYRAVRKFDEELAYASLF